MASAQKKVVVRQTGGRLAWGYLPQGGFVRDGQVGLIEVDARAKLLDLSEIETIAYVRDFNLEDAEEPERMGRRSFPARPRGEGLWVRVAFREAAALEGLVSFEMGCIDRLLEDQGVFLVPPDGRGNTLRVFVPRAAMMGMEVLGWVTSPTKKLAEKAAKEMAKALQGGLFGESSE